uniref:Uncharacterized protein n=1 Tax=Arundo donax TaxID=35708 RepID=A0A0A9H7F3_ARUDO
MGSPESKVARMSGSELRS